MNLTEGKYYSLPGVAPGLYCVHWTPSGENLAKYDVALNHRRHEESRLLLGTNKKDTRLGVFFIWDPAVTYSPGPSPAKYHRR